MIVLNMCFFKIYYLAVAMFATVWSFNKMRMQKWESILEPMASVGKLESL